MPFFDGSSYCETDSTVSSSSVSSSYSSSAEMKFFIFSPILSIEITSHITDYISTNIISICDGQIVLSEKNFSKGEKPAIDYGLSVSRLGGNVQDDMMKKVGSKVRIDLLSYLDVRQIYELANIDEMSEELQRKLRDGKKILDTLKQYKFSPRSKEEMMNSYKFITERDTK